MDGLLLIGLLKLDFSKISTKMQRLLLKEMHFTMLSTKWETFCSGLNVLIHHNDLHCMNVFH